MCSLVFIINFMICFQKNTDDPMISEEYRRPNQKQLVSCQSRIGNKMDKINFQIIFEIIAKLDEVEKSFSEADLRWAIHFFFVYLHCEE